MITVKMLRAEIASIVRDAALYEETSFAHRCEALAQLEFCCLQFEALKARAASPAALRALKRMAARAIRRLEAIDDGLFQRLRTEIRTGRHRGTAFTRLVERYTDEDDGGSRALDEVGYDILDSFLNRLLFSQPMPSASQALGAEMVPYQPTPARLVFALVAQAQLKPDDIFYDIGSGLGRVAILVHLLTGADTKGVEYDPALCAYARNCVRELGLTQVEFLEADARAADYTSTTVFFLYTPCTGTMLQEVLDKLRAAGCGRALKLFSYGPCTAQLARQPWLVALNDDSESSDKLAEFRIADEPTKPSRVEMPNAR